MAHQAVLYLIAHQPRRLRLPPGDLPPGAPAASWEEALFDDAANRFYLERVAEKSYRPAAALLRQLAAEGLAVGLALTASLLWQLERWLPEVAQELTGLWALPRVEPVGVDPRHTVRFCLDAPGFRAEMARTRAELSSRTGRTLRAADTTEMFMGDVIATALAQAGYEAAFADGRPCLLGWREPTHLYRTRQGLVLLVRHPGLSDDVGYRFSNRQWSEWPLTARRYAEWIGRARGEIVVVGWDFETFGEHHWADTGIFEFLAELPRALAHAGVETVTPSEAVRRLGPSAYDLPLPATPCTWAGDGDRGFFFGNPAQRRVLEGMALAYQKAQLLGREDYLDLVGWLLQSDHLHCLQWYGQEGPLAEVSAYFTPREWWPLGPEGIVEALAGLMQQVALAMG